MGAAEAGSEGTQDEKSSASPQGEAAEDSQTTEPPVIRLVTLGDADYIIGKLPRRVPEGESFDYFLSIIPSKKATSPGASSSGLVPEVERPDCFVEVPTCGCNGLCSGLCGALVHGCGCESQEPGCPSEGSCGSEGPSCNGDDPDTGDGDGGDS